MRYSKNIVWLASYPKSGNTWFRVFLSNLLDVRDAPAHINELRQTPIISSRPMFDQLTGIASSDLPPDIIHAWQPDVFRHIAANSTELQFFKIHDANFPLKDGQLFIPPEITKGVLYFVRNPLDVCVSFAHHMAKDIDHAVKVLNNESFGFCMHSTNLSHQLRQLVSDWSSHVKSWTESHLPVHVMRYEDMLENPEKTFSEALEFLDLSYKKEDIEKAIKFSKFAQLKAQEQQEGFKEKNIKAKSFFRKGVTNDWKNHLSQEQVNAIVEKHKDVMKRFGYN
ncbi:MAG: sulfotransferase domain-containing protein [Bacteroidetes bacterium]|jgi:hypothetical protein|nr:sulfotransferase domain-containing protein [Bacteroidota bacterium]